MSSLQSLLTYQNGKPSPRLASMSISMLQCRRQQLQSVPTTNTFTILLQGAKEKIYLPEKLSTSTSKLKLRTSLLTGQHTISLDGKKLWQSSLISYLSTSMLMLSGILMGIGRSWKLKQFQGYKKPEKHEHKQFQLRLQAHHVNCVGEEKGLVTTVLCRHFTRFHWCAMLMCASTFGSLNTCQICIPNVAPK